MRNKKLVSFLLFVCLIPLLCVSFYGCKRQPSLQSMYSSVSMPTQAAHATYPGRTLAEAADYATTIVYGEITSIQPTCKDVYESPYPDIPAEPLIMTHIQISPIEVLKGENAVTTYKRLGGEFEGVRYTQEGDDRNLAVGQKIVVFLNAHNYDLGPQYVMVEEDGQVFYEDNTTHELVYTSVENYLEMIRAQLA